MLLALLATAAWLEPNSQGLGTHQQLGLPPCSIRMLFGIRCPACGMTTSWAHVMSANLPSAFGANVGGALLALAATVLGPWSVLSGVLGRWVIRPPSDWLMIGGAFCIVAVTLIEWVGRLLATPGS
jgi:hypothetical protein